MREKNEIRVYNADNIAKSNILIQSKSKTTILGNKLIALGLYHLQTGDFKLSESGGNLVCTLTAPEIRARLGKEGNSIYRDLNATAKRLLKYELSYKDPEKKEFRYVNLFTEMKYEDGEFSITFNGDMKSYLHELKDNYTLLNLPLMLKWNRTYTFRLFELLSSKTYLFKNKGYECEVEFGLAEFKFTIGCYDADDEKVRSFLKGKQSPDFEKAEEIILESKDKEQKWYDFRRYIIDPSVEEINSTEEANMIIDAVEPVKKGRGGKVCGIIFKYRINVQNKNVTEDIEDELAATAEEMSEDEKFDFEANVKNNVFGYYKLPISDIRALCAVAKYNLDVLQNAADLLAEQRGTINNVTGWLLSCIKSEYSAVRKEENEKNPTALTKTAVAYNSYPQRHYSDEELSELEEKLLNQM